MSPTSPPNSSPFSILFDIQTAQSQMMSKHRSTSVARSTFFILPLLTFMLPVTFAALVGCTTNAFGAIPHGTATLNMTQLLWLKMRISPGCKGCTLREFTSCSHSQITRPVKVENKLSMRLWAGLCLLPISVTPILACGLSNLKVCEGIDQSRWYHWKELWEGLIFCPNTVLGCCQTTLCTSMLSTDSILTLWTLT